MVNKMLANPAYTKGVPVHVPTPPFPVHLHSGLLEKVLDVSLHAWVPASHLGDISGALGSLVLSGCAASPWGKEQRREDLHLSLLFCHSGSQVNKIFKMKLVLHTLIHTKKGVESTSTPSPKEYCLSLYLYVCISVCVCIYV